MRIAKPAIGALAAVGLVLAPAAPAHAVSDTIVINEVQTRGSNGGFDEFIEIHNLHPTQTVDITGWHVDGCNSSDTVRTRLTSGEPGVVRPSHDAPSPVTPALLAIIRDAVERLRVRPDGLEGDLE